MSKKCFECNAPAHHAHHVIPVALGGTKTVELCVTCHGKVHARHMVTTSALTKLSLQKKKAKGERTGGIPYGFKLAKDGVRLLRNKQEQRTIAYVVRRWRNGASYRAIVISLNLDHKPRGRKWSPTSVWRIVKANT